MQHRPTVSETKTTPEVVDELLAELRQRAAADDLGEYHVRDMEIRLGRFGQFHSGPIIKVVHDVVQEFLDSLQMRDRGRPAVKDALVPVGKRTRNNYRAAVSELLQFAKIKGYLPQGLAKATDAIRKARVKKGKNHVLTPEQLTILLERCKPHLVPFIATKSFDGIRTEETWKMEWPAVMTEQDVIEVTPDISKLGQRRLPPLQANLKQWLAPFRNLKGKLHPCYASINSITQAVKREATRFKIETKRNTFRNGYISYRVAATGNAYQTALEAGTSVATIEREYKELVTKKAAEEYFAIVPSKQRLAELEAYVANLTSNQLEYSPRHRPPQLKGSG